MEYFFVDDHHRKAEHKLLLETQDGRDGSLCFESIDFTAVEPMHVKARAYQRPGVEFPAGQNGNVADRNITRFDLALLPNSPTKAVTKFRHAGVKFRLLTSSQQR